MYPLKFEPILKQTLWGGDKIIPFKHLNSDLKGVGESWEISGVEANESVVANGPDKGLTLAEMVRKYREELVGDANHLQRISATLSLHPQTVFRAAKECNLTRTYCLIISFLIHEAQH